jgi:purine nucleosidase
VLGRAGSAAPVFPGASRPLLRPLVTAKETHGPDGLGDHQLPSADSVRPTSTAILDALRAAGEPVTLVTLGPLTNLALALRNDPAFLRSRVIRHVAMGGNIAAAGNSGGLAEFNVWCDPEAAAEVFAARLGTELVGLDVTRRLVIPAPAVHKLASHPDADARWLGRLLGFYVRFHQEYEGLPGAVVNDPLAVALALEPAWGTADTVPIAVRLAEASGRGETRVGGAGDPPVRVYRDITLGPVHDLLLEYLFGRWLTKADFQP